jgi:hypothetical protein
MDLLTTDSAESFYASLGTTHLLALLTAITSTLA